MTLPLRRLEEVEAKARECARNIDVESIIREGDVRLGEGGEIEFQIFLGTVFAFYPSGKYYTPWATGNLDPCPACGGKGEMRRTAAQRRRWKKWSNARRKYFTSNRTEKAMKAYQGMKRNAPKACPWCDGTGSHEAAQDEAWRDAFEDVIEDRDMYITEGEGDPCDLFLGTSISFAMDDDAEDVVEMEAHYEPEMYDVFASRAKEIQQAIDEEEQY